MKEFRGKHRIWNTAFAQAVLVCVLLAAQALALAHDLDVESHAQDDVCVLCITIGGLGGVQPGNAQPAFASLAFDPPPSYRPPVNSFNRRTHRFARGPPTAS